MVRMVTVIGMVTTVALAGCVNNSRQAEFNLAVAECGRDTGAPGTYSISPNKRDAHGLPLVVAERGGTRRGEILMSECLGQRLGTKPVPEAAKPAPAKVSGGKLPLPTQYALLPGDEALWPTLTLEQQQRAILFLQDGSTIRASLEGDI